MRIKKNKILITGATSGIGRAMLDRFLRLDNEVVAVGRSREKLQELEALDPRISAFSCDLSKSEELDELVVFIENEHPDLNILINNAGLQYNYHFMDEKHPLAKIEHEVSVNLSAPIKLISLLLPTLEANENRAIVNVSSGLGLVPKQSAPVYCATKAGLHIFSQSLRYQLDKIKVFEVMPPLVDTAMTKGRGANKLTPEKLVDEFINGFASDKYEINIGKVKLLNMINRVAPFLAKKIMKGEDPRSKVLA